MWLSRRYRNAAGSFAASGEVTIGGGNVAVLTDAEDRSATLWSAGGYVWRPAPGDGVLVIKREGEDDAVVGVKMDEAPGGMNGGEVYIKSKTASVWLRNDGKIEICGDVEITGSLKINGNAVT